MEVVEKRHRKPFLSIASPELSVKLRGLGAEVLPHRIRALEGEQNMKTSHHENILSHNVPTKTATSASLNDISEITSCRLLLHVRKVRRLQSIRELGFLAGG